MKFPNQTASVSPPPGGLRPRIFLLLGAWLVATLGTISSSSQERRSARPNPLMKEDVQRGSALYAQHCSGCHGAEARGGIGPTLIDSSLVRHDDNGNLIGTVVHNGRVPKGMPAFPSLTDAQVSDIVGFLHASIEVNDRRDFGGPTRGLALSSLLAGNAEAGKRYFEGAGGCSKCHSSSGDLGGIAKKYMPLELMGRLLYPDQKKRTATVQLPGGERVHGQLRHLDAFTVAIDSDAGYRSWPVESGVKVTVDDPLRAHRDLLDTYRDEEIHDVFAYLETLR